jgi:transposase
MMLNSINAIPPVPKETARSARAILGHGNFYIRVGDQLESILEDIRPEGLLERGIILPQITSFQFLEGLTDAQAFDAIRTRIDWKFALHLPLYTPTFFGRALCEFRQRVLVDPVCQREFQELIDRLIPYNHPFIDRFHNFNYSYVVSRVCAENHLSLIHEALSKALEALACNFPTWLQEIALPHWNDRYIYLVHRFYSTAPPRQQEQSLKEIHTDIHYLLEKVHRSGSDEIKELQEIKVLDHICMRQFEKSCQVMKNRGKFSKFNNCDFCLHKERMDPDSMYE